jgi:hypothetical protein
LKFDGFIFFALSLIVLILIQRLLQREIQIFLLLTTGRTHLAIGIYSILLLPGVFIHELSHLLMAIILRVRVLKISFVPEVNKKGRIRLGFVQTAKTDVVRDSLIGLAPFLVGLFFVALIGIFIFGVENRIYPTGLDYLSFILNTMQKLPEIKDFGIWFYLAFAISTTMFPSESDRQSWKIIILSMLFILVIVVISGFGDWMIVHLYPIINQWLFSLSLILLGSLIIHIILIIPIWIIRQVIMGLFGYRLIKN